MQDVGRDDGVVQRGGEAVQAPPRQLLVEDRFVAKVSAGAAVGFRNRQAQQARLARLSPHGALHHAIRAPLGHAAFRNVVVQKLRHRLFENADVLVPEKVRPFDA